MVIRLTEIADRPRPDKTFVWKETLDGTSSYPSGHVIYTVLIFGALAYLALQHMNPSWRRTALVGFLVAIIALMGIMRVVELDHWPADVTASYLIALPLLLGGIWLYPRLPSWLHERLPWVFSILNMERKQD
ncbi:MAG: phosphatase PAP2 family protein [Chloroflexi bacterium]|nr:phosphatase PAP2 family protein [Chloroflexota bacterium]